MHRHIRVDRIAAKIKYICKGILIYIDNNKKEKKQ